MEQKTENKISKRGFESIGEIIKRSPKYRIINKMIKGEWGFEG